MKAHHNLVQGSEDWDVYRASKFNASEAAAMLGLTNNVTRNELLKAKATLCPKEYGAWTIKHLFEKGHEAEASARVIIESQIGEDLYPSVYSEGKLSVSCDGITLDEFILWEHKLYNQSLIESIKNGDIPDYHMPQLQQALMITRAEKCIFTVSDGTSNNIFSVDILPNPAWFKRITDGWRQFEIDMEAYVPTAEFNPAKAAPIMQLPALFVQVRGEVTASNLTEFRRVAEQFIADINADLLTDEDFAQAEETVKFCESAETSIEAAKSNAIAQTASIDELMRALDHIKAQLRSKRLYLVNQVKTKKDEIRQSIIFEAKRQWSSFVGDLSASITPIKLVVKEPDLVSAIKNKRTITSLQNAVDTCLANAKIEANAIHNQIVVKLGWYKSYTVGFEFLFTDLQQIIYKDTEHFEMIVNSRIDAYKIKQEQDIATERERIQKGADRKAKEDIDRKLAEQREADEMARKQSQDEIDRLAKTEQEKINPKNDCVEGEALKPVEIHIKPAAQIVVEHQDEISRFLKARNVDKATEQKIRPWLVEFVKFQESNTLKAA